MEAGHCRREGVVVLVVSPQECGGGWPLHVGGCCSAGCEPPGMWWRLAAAGGRVL